MLYLVLGQMCTLMCAEFFYTMKDYILLLYLNMSNKDYFSNKRLAIF